MYARSLLSLWEYSVNIKFFRLFFFSQHICTQTHIKFTQKIYHHVVRGNQYSATQAKKKVTLSAQEKEGD